MGNGKSKMSNGKLIILKTATYRLTLFVVMTIFTYLWFGNFGSSLAFSTISFLMGTAWYWLHEHLWDQ